MTHDELIEAAARAICEADKPNFEKRERWPIINPVLQAQFKGIARAAISVIAPAVLDATLKAQRDCEYPTDLPQWATRANLSRAAYVCAWEDGSQAVEEAIRALKTRYE